MLDGIFAVFNTAILGMSAVSPGIPELLRSNIRIVTVILLIVAALFWLILLYVRLRKKSRFISHLTLFGMIAIPILAAIGVVIMFLPSDKTVILVASFEEPEPETHRVTDLVLTQLRRATKAYKNVQIKALGEVITEEGGSIIAHSRGQKHKASIVLWGWLDKSEEPPVAVINFEALGEKYHLPLYNENQVLRLELEELQSFQIQEQLSSEMSYLTLVTIGLSRLMTKDYDGAITRFTHAIQYRPPEKMATPAAVYFLRGFAHLLGGEYDSAVEDYDEVIRFNPEHFEAYVNRGVAYHYKDEYERAIEDYNKASEIKVNKPAVYTNRGVVHFARSDSDLAIEGTQFWVF